MMIDTTETAERKSRPLSLRTWLVVLLSTALILPTLLWGLVYTVGLGSVSRSILLDTMKQRGDSHAEALAQQLYLPWRHVAYLASTLDTGSKDDLRNTLTRVVETDHRYLWLGVAQTDGKIVAASSGHKQGTDVTGRDWFEAGLRGPFVGEPHSDDALARLLPPRSNGYLFFDYAAPIRDADGLVVGVLGAKFDWSRLKLPRSRFAYGRMQTLLVDRRGEVLIGPEAMKGERLTTAGVLARSSLRVNTWSDGVTYVSVMVPNMTYGDMPSPGMSLIVRQEAAQAYQPLRLLIRHFWHAVGLGAILMLVVIVALSCWVAAPVSRFAQFALGLSQGQGGEPPEHHAYREAEQLSTALTRIQCRLGALEKAQPHRLSVHALSGTGEDSQPQHVARPS